MVDQVRFPPSIGGSGKTYTNDANPETGMFGGGHRLNFFPIQADMVAAAGYVSQYAQAIDGAKANADRAEDARGYVEAVAGALKSNILDYYRHKATLDLDFERGIYRSDNGTLIETTGANEVISTARSTVKIVSGPDGSFREEPINELARDWQSGQPRGVLIEPPSTNNLPENNNLLSGAYSTTSTTDLTLDDEQSSIIGKNVYRLNANATSASLQISAIYTEVMQRSCFSIIVKPDQCENILLIYRSSSHNDVRVVVGIRDGLLKNSQNFNGNIFHRYLGNGFYEIGYEDSGVDRHTSFIAKLQNGISTSLANLAYTVGDGGWLSLPQVETSTRPTSRIITQASPVTRSADTLSSIVNINSFTLLSQVIRNSATPNATVIKVGDDNSLSGFNGLGVQSETAGSLGSLNFRLGINRVQSASFSLPVNQLFTLGISFSLTEKKAVVFIDGTNVAEISLSNFSVTDIKSVLKRLYVLSGDPMGGAFNRTLGACRYALVIPYAMTNSELAEVTSQ